MLYEKITGRIPIERGWSGDRKYKVTIEGESYLLRTAPPERQERMMRQYKLMKLLAAREIPMCLPMEWGICEEGAYLLISWIDGPDALDAIPQMPEGQQYAYGLEAGQILHKIHGIPAPGDAEPWGSRFNRKIDRKIAMYEACPLKYEEDAPLFSFIAENRHLLHDRPQCLQHGDYHIGNMMLDRDGKLTIIDFDRDDWGDPWEEFNRIVWCAQEAPALASGMVDGYFDGQVPEAFWHLLALYICSNTLSSLPWAVPFGEREIDVMRQQQKEIMNWYDAFRKVLPGWYRPH